MKICEAIDCTGCSACKDVCPKHCIDMRPDELGAMHPVVNEILCVECGLCQKTCPNNRETQFRIPEKVYAAWSKDEQVRNTSASGGLAYELYRYWLSNGGVATGVMYDRDGGCRFVLVEKLEDLPATQNSKYTFSNTNGIYKVVKEKLNENVPVLFIGTPCQVAGLYGYLKKDYSILTTIDLICHGMPPATYLEQHIANIERQKRNRVKRLFFRDPRYRTSAFTFTMYNDDDHEFYRKKVLSNDNFQLGYHHALIYRENCYNCRYARKERISDLTIGDFSGVGRLTACSYNGANVSCVLQNTDRGCALLRGTGDAIYKEERPCDEAYAFERQLKTPSVKHKNRRIFEDIYSGTGDFEKAANAALKNDKVQAYKKRTITFLKTKARKLVPRCIVTLIKKTIRRNAN